MRRKSCPAQNKKKKKKQTSILFVNVDGSIKRNLLRVI